MNSCKLSDRWNYIHQLIKQERTGALREFSKRVGISKSQLNRELEDMKLMGAPIEYCSILKTYRYSKKVEFKFEFKVLDLNDTYKINGGQLKEFKNNLACPIWWDKQELILQCKLNITAI
jgi:hypothetical protein